MPNTMSNNPKRMKSEKKKQKKELPKMPSATSILTTRILPLLFAFLVAIVAIVLSGGGRKENQKEAEHAIPIPKWDPPDPRIAYFLGQACKVAKCHDALQAVHRSFRAKRPIPAGETLFEVPRSMQLWDLDALRDPFVREHLFRASHQMSGNPVGAEAFLAAFLALEINRSLKSHNGVDPLRLAYFDSLPSLQELAYHPILTDADLILHILGRSASHAVLQAYRNMIVSEWEAFASSTEFTKLVTRADYFTSRLNVLTRAVRTGPPGPEEVMAGSFLSSELQQQDLLVDELQAYQDLLGLNLSEGCIALVPIQDLFNHHPKNSVEFQYQRNATSSFVVTTEPIQQGYEPMVSYGVMADAHLFARYGFVNGDGSGHTEIAISFHHDILRLNISSQYDYLPSSGTTNKFKALQETNVAKYISFDDGYDECIPGPASHPEQAELKRLKYQHLMNIANDYDKWTVLMPPRGPDSRPSTDIATQITTQPPHYQRENLVQHTKPQFDTIKATCRLMSLINTDFDGNAMALLQDNLENATFVLGPGNDDLEFRSLMCVGRWVGTTLLTMELQGTMRSESDRVYELNLHAFGSRNWTAYHVRLGEMLALQATQNLALEAVTERWEYKKHDVSPEYNMRDQACPQEYSEFLLAPSREPTFDDL